jgi:hypothetical protein
LEPLSRTSLAKYISAEQPANPHRPQDVMDQIHKRAIGATGGMAINRVGVLYHTLVAIFSDPTRLPETDLDGTTASTFQADPDEWGGNDTLLVRRMAGRAEAVKALQLIGEQGEGPDGTSSGDLSEPAHFDRFFDIYTYFPETDTHFGVLEWQPARAVPTHPNTLADPAPEPDIECGRITEPTSRLWAQLFNVRYRMLLLDLAHHLHLSGKPSKDDGDRPLRELLVEWTFQEMVGFGSAGLRGLAQRLTTLPRRPDGGTHVAGPPFELPYTLDLPDRERDRWRLHRTLLDTSAFLIQQLEQPGSTDPILDELKDLDADARAVVEAQIVATA